MLYNVDFLFAQQTSCRLDLFKAEGENLIINATLYEEDGANIPTRQTVSESFLIKEKVRTLYTYFPSHPH